MSQFLAVRENTDNYWIETDGDLIAQELVAAGGESGIAKKYWLIKRSQSGIVNLKPVILSPAISRTVDRREIKADGKVFGGVDL